LRFSLKEVSMGNIDDFGGVRIGFLREEFGDGSDIFNGVVGYNQDIGIIFKSGMS
jgi:hypothetical protein